LNYIGSEKFSKYLVNYLKENYSISDRRGDTKYQSWQDSADYLRELVYNQKMLDCTDMTTTIDMLNSNPYYLTFVSIDGKCDISDERVVNFMQLLGIEHIDENGAYLISQGALQWKATEESPEWYQNSGRHDILISTQNGNRIVVDNKKHAKIGNGINIVVYDTLAEGVIGDWGLSSEYDYYFMK
jgi:hypothetical protein